MYSIYKRIIAVILLCSQLLTITSCSSNYSNIPIQSKIVRAEKKIHKNSSRDDLVLPLTDSLLVISTDGTNLSLKYNGQNWQAEVVTDTHNEIKQILPVVSEPGYSIANLITASEEEQRELVHLVVNKKDPLCSTYVYIGKEACTEQIITSQVQVPSSTRISDNAADSPKMLTHSIEHIKIPASTLSKRIEKEQKLDLTSGNTIIAHPAIDNTKQAIKRHSPISVLHNQYSGSSLPTKPTYKEQQPKCNRHALSEYKNLEWYERKAQDKQIAASSLGQVDRSTVMSDHISLAERLTEGHSIPSYIAKGRHQVYPILIEGKWMAIVQENAPRGFSRTHYLELYLAPGSAINDLSKHSSKWHENHISVIFTEQSSSDRGYVYIGESGLLGGGNSGSKGGGGNDNDYSSRESSSSSGSSSKNESSRSSKHSSSSSENITHDKERGQSTSSSSTSSSSTYSSFKPSAEQRAASAMLSSIGIKSELPTYHFAKSYPNDYSYSSPHVSSSSRDYSYSSTAMDIISSSGKTTVSTPTPIISYRAVTSIGDDTSSSEPAEGVSTKEAKREVIRRIRRGKKEERTKESVKQQKRSYSMKVDGRELNPDNCVLNNPRMAENIISLYKALAEELKDHPNPKMRNFQFQVTGGDRYEKDGKAYSSTNHQVVPTAKPTGAHMEENGARAVDIRIKLSDGTDIVPFEIIERLIYKRKCTNLIIDYKVPPSFYPDKHYHLQLPNTQEYGEDKSKKGK
jgi:hypothetical protein